MGRHCGFIAMNATLAARHVDICLIPEMDIDLEKVLSHAVQLMKTQRYAVIVVAEGCGDTLIKGTGETDAGGNKLLADAGLFLKEQITARFKREGLPLTIKYIDPTYMIRAVPANAFDSKYCSTLAQNAVHGALAGYSGITVGKVNERYVYLPIHAITKQDLYLSISLSLSIYIYMYVCMYIYIYICIRMHFINNSLHKYFITEQAGPRVDTTGPS